MSGWSESEAEAWLASLEPLGIRFGLERIRRLVTALGMPQHRFASIHVVGTNGKSSVTEMTSALLEAHGRRAGAYLSPHVSRWSERVRVGGDEIQPARFAASVERVAQSVEVVNRALEGEESITQFEAATAAAFVALASAGVEVGVIEAGLGGRLDATNVIPSLATALTSVGLEHTEWLGDTEEEIAAEKLAVLRDHTTLVVGRVSAGVRDLAARVAAKRSARLVEAGDLPGEVRLAIPGPYARRDFAVAMAASEAVLGGLDLERVCAVAAALELPGRMQIVPGQPPLILDAAHNPDGARALAEALPEAVGDSPVVACLALLADKDSVGVLDALASRIELVVCTEITAERLSRSARPGARALPVESLAGAARDAGLEAEAVSQPRAAVRRALDEAVARGGVALVCGSHYLLGDAWTERHDPSSSR
ncbi:MAG: bifunctional folylpolyglutamate synthase/dihydrofolate synthase [Solirubrobacterales bacterium]